MFAKFHRKPIIIIRFYRPSSTQGVGDVAHVRSGILNNLNIVNNFYEIYTSQHCTSILKNYNHTFFFCNNFSIFQFELINSVNLFEFKYDQYISSKIV